MTLFCHSPRHSSGRDSGMNLRFELKMIVDTECAQVGSDDDDGLNDGDL
eukprot:CAMPEP_0172316834 /NCGR_PEP_ID=MMETSP1058-20130122/29687_1 /TAXON_ID=83371 /ORGANISM="Detonula confervacea, Strain CCMP 353" /LENGTH=48 /DNA_ID= /DNA_START= /DNA_END= /DNA_ORIENTATION=